MTVTCTYDHRIIQGAESGMFLAKLQPETPPTIALAQAAAQKAADETNKSAAASAETPAEGDRPLRKPLTAPWRSGAWWHSPSSCWR
jgi:hypothetical protein